MPRSSDEPSEFYRVWHGRFFPSPEKQNAIQAKAGFSPEKVL
jgi:hypothetical protein